jgi:hypothetical protein
LILPMKRSLKIFRANRSWQSAKSLPNKSKIPG